jgi:hypothetical protein
MMKHLFDDGNLSRLGWATPFSCCYSTRRAAQSDLPLPSILTRVGALHRAAAATLSSY